jgi:hypothetical protein
MNQLRIAVFGFATVLALSVSAVAQVYPGGASDPRQHGFERGYRHWYDDGYSRYPDDPAGRTYEDRGWGNRDVAYDIGYRDGVSMGQHDFSRHKEFRPQKNDQYEDADRGYRKSYGYKKDYKARYRDGFLRGYADGYKPGA